MPVSSQFSSTRLAALTRLLLYLTNSFAFLRKHTALRLYETLLLLSDSENELEEADNERALKLLTETDWLEVKNKELLREARNQLAAILKVTLPPMKAKTVAPS